MNKEQEFANFIAKDIQEGIKVFKDLYISSTFELNGCKQFQPFNWLTLTEECALLNVSVSLDLKNNIIIATPIK